MALWRRKLLQATPRARPSGAGVFQELSSAATSSAWSVRGVPLRRSRRKSIASRLLAIASSSSADSRANSVWELPTERQTMIGTPESTLVDSSRKFVKAYGGSTAPVVVMKSTPLLNRTSPTNGRFGDVGCAAI